MWGRGAGGPIVASLEYCYRLLLLSVNMMTKAKHYLFFEPPEKLSGPACTHCLPLLPL